jgi:hypothetical protein
MYAEDDGFESGTRDNDGDEPGDITHLLIQHPPGITQ